MGNKISNSINTHKKWWFKSYPVKYMPIYHSIAVPLQPPWYAIFVCSYKIRLTNKIILYFNYSKASEKQNIVFIAKLKNMLHGALIWKHFWSTKKNTKQTHNNNNLEAALLLNNNNLPASVLIKMITATWHTFPAACWDAIDPNTECVVASVTVVTKKHLILVKCQTVNSISEINSWKKPFAREMSIKLQKL